MLAPIEILSVLLTLCALTQIIRTAHDKKNKELNKELQDLRYMEGILKGIDTTLDTAVEIAKEKIGRCKDCRLRGYYSLCPMMHKSIAIIDDLTTDESYCSKFEPNDKKKEKEA